MVSFMPSELVFTIYSAPLASPVNFDPLFISLVGVLLPALDLALKSVGTSLCWAFTLKFNLSTMADSDPLRLRTLLGFPFESELGDGKDSKDTLSVMFKSKGFILKELDLLLTKTPRFLSLSLEPSLLLLFSPEFLLEGELAAFFRVDMLGLPLPLAEGCFGLEIPAKPCLGLDGT